MLDTSRAFRWRFGPGSASTWLSVVNELSSNVPSSSNELSTCCWRFVDGLSSNSLYVLNDESSDPVSSPGESSLVCEFAKDEEVVFIMTANDQSIGIRDCNDVCERSTRFCATGDSRIVSMLPTILSAGDTRPGGELDGSGSRDLFRRRGTEGAGVWLVIASMGEPTGIGFGDDCGVGGTDCDDGKDTRCCGIERSKGMGFRGGCWVGGADRDASSDCVPSCKGSDSESNCWCSTSD